MIFIDESMNKLKSDTLVLLLSKLINFRSPSDAVNWANVVEDEMGIKNPKKKYTSGNKSIYKNPTIKKRVGKVVYHIVKSGENISVIARKYKTTWVMIRQLNDLTKNKIIKPGQKLRVK